MLFINKTSFGSIEASQDKQNLQYSKKQTDQKTKTKLYSS